MPYINLAGSALGYAGKTAQAATAGDAQYQTNLVRQILGNQAYKARRNTDIARSLDRNRAMGLAAAKSRAAGMEKILKEGAALGYGTDFNGFRDLADELWTNDKTPDKSQFYGATRAFGLPRSAEEVGYVGAYQGFLNSVMAQRTLDGQAAKRDQVLAVQAEGEDFGITPEQTARISVMAADDGTTPGEMREEIEKVRDENAQARQLQVDNAYIVDEAETLRKTNPGMATSVEALELYGNLTSGKTPKRSDLVAYRILMSDGKEALDEFRAQSVNLGVRSEQLRAMNEASAQRAEYDNFGFDDGMPQQTDDTAYMQALNGTEPQSQYGPPQQDSGPVRLDKNTHPNLWHSFVGDMNAAGEAGRLQKVAQQEGWDLNTEWGQGKARMWVADNYSIQDLYDVSTGRFARPDTTERDFQNSTSVLAQPKHEDPSIGPAQPPGSLFPQDQ